MTPTTPTPERPATPTLVALALVTACTLALQVVVSRLLAAVLAYHFSFLAVSIAMLGTGAGALLVYARPAWFDDRSTPEVLARWAGRFAATAIAAPILIVRLDFTGVNTMSASFVLSITAASVVLSLPALASGVVVALAITRYQAAIGAVYAFDLAGAGIGALAVVPTLSLAPAPNLMVAIGMLVAGASALFAGSRSPARRTSAILVVAGAASLVIASASPLLYANPGYILPPGTRTIAERWTPLARSFGFQQPNPAAPALLFYDRVFAPVPIVRGDTLPTWREIGTGPASIGFELTGPGRTLVIGGGGGRDIYNALTSGQTSVDVIELIEGNRRIVDEDLGALSGRPYSRAGVSTVIGDGRSVLASRDTKYDQIHLGFTDTLTASSAQGFALTEQNLYTLEAFDEYLDHLTPRGILNVSRLLKLVGDEALRITVLTLVALERRGISDPFAHVIVVLGRDPLGPATATVLARLTPYTPAEVRAAGRLVEERGVGLLLSPGGVNQLEWKTLSEAPSVRAFCESHRLDVCPPTDDRPFFFNMDRLSQLGEPIDEGYFYATRPISILLLTLIVLGALSVVAFAVPLRLVDGAERPKLGPLVYFAAIGAGFMMLEMVLIQRLVLFLGYPTYALSVVLFSLLVFAGIGSFWCTRLAGDRGTLLRALGVACALIFAFAFGLAPLLRSAIDLTLPARIAVAIAVTAPLGVTLGMAMPLGLARLQALSPRATPYAWGVNGIASVLASVISAVIAIQFGFTIATLAAGACYAIAVAHVAIGRSA